MIGYFVLGMERSGINLFIDIISNKNDIIIYDNITIDTKLLLHNRVKYSENATITLFVFRDTSIPRFNYLKNKIKPLYKFEKCYEIVVIRDLLNLLSSRLSSKLLVNQKVISLAYEHYNSSYSKFNYNLFHLDENYRNKFNFYDEWEKPISNLYLSLPNLTNVELKLDFDELFNINYCLPTKKKEIKKVAVVTAIFLVELDCMDQPGVFKKNENFDYCLFTNDKSKIDPNIRHLWDIIEISMDYKYGVFATKHVKWLTHKYLPDYDVIIWVDSFITPNVNIETLVNKVYYDEPMITMRTQNAPNVQADIDWCIQKKRISIPVANEIVKHLRANNFNTLETVQTYWSSGMIKNNKSSLLHEMAEELFSLIITKGYRDQHWLPYLFRKYNISCPIIKENVFVNTGKQLSHNHKYDINYLNRY